MIKMANFKYNGFVKWYKTISDTIISTNFNSKNLIFGGLTT